MGQWLWELWNDKTAAKRAVRGLSVALALGASTAAGAEVLRHLGVTSPEARSLLVMLLGGTGASISVGERNRPRVGDPPLEMDARK